MEKLFQENEAKSKKLYEEKKIKLGSARIRRYNW
jgi:hypothetical protein